MLPRDREAGRRPRGGASWPLTTRRCSTRIGARIDPTGSGRPRSPVAEQQLVLVARALARRCRDADPGRADARR
ncbi:MAG: hypothetical protein WKG07_36110 [Hymenobacter sp.]